MSVNGPMAFRQMLQEATASRAARRQCTQARRLQQQIDRDARKHGATGGAKALGIISLLAPVPAVGVAFIVALYVQDFRAASALMFLSTVFVGVGLVAGTWALTDGIKYRTRAGRGMGITGICIGCLILLLPLFSATIDRAFWHAHHLQRFRLQPKQHTP